MAVLCGMPTTEYSAVSARLYLISGSLGSLESSMQTASRSLQPFLQGSLGERPTDHATWSVTISGIYVRSTALQSNNNYRLKEPIMEILYEAKNEPIIII